MAAAAGLQGRCPGAAPAGEADQETGGRNAANGLVTRTARTANRYKVAGLPPAAAGGTVAQVA
jgi:hypothetical protein